MADRGSYFVAMYMQTDTTWELKKTIKEKEEDKERSRRKKLLWAWQLELAYSKGESVAIVSLLGFQ